MELVHPDDRGNVRGWFPCAVRPYRWRNRDSELYECPYLPCRFNGETIPVGTVLLSSEGSSYLFAEDLGKEEVSCVGGYVCRVISVHVIRLKRIE